MFNKTFSITLIIINIILISVILLSLSSDSSNINCIKQQIFPACNNLKLDFAGENIPTKDPEVYERLDREMVVNIYWQSNMMLNLKYAEKYFPIIEPILKRYGIPDDFKYLALAESGLRDVVSPAGASGKWQFMKETARSFGLIVNEEIDERYNLQKSTVAACKYFLSSKSSINSWSCIAAGYNMGIAGIIKNMREQNDTNYFNLWLNQETSRYVFRIVALKEIHKNHNKYGFYYTKDDLFPEIKTKKEFLQLPNNNLVAYAQSKGISYKTLRYYNPWIKGKQITTLKDSTEIELPLN